jgi:hypothetical protein
MPNDDGQPLWKDRLSTVGNVITVLGATGFVLGILSHGLPAIVMFSVSGAFLFVGVLAHVFLSSAQPLESINDHLRYLPMRRVNPPDEPQGLQGRSPDHSAVGKVATPEANINFCLDEDDNYFRVRVDDQKIFRETPERTALEAIVLQFRNEPNPPRRVSTADNVRSTVLYRYGYSNIHELRTDHACWLNEPSSTVSLEVGVPYYLILGILRPVGTDYNFQVYDRSEPSIPGVMSAGSATWNVTVKLFWGEGFEFGIEKDFELVTKLDGDEKFFELFYLGDKHNPVRQSRGRRQLR